MNYKFYFFKEISQNNIFILITKTFKKKIGEIQNARNNEIYTDFINAFSQSNFFNFDDKEDCKKNNIEDNSKNSTNSQLTNDDSFEREISDEEIIIKKDFVKRKRIRKNKN